MEIEQRYYLPAQAAPALRIHHLVEGACWYVAADSGGKLLITNQPL